MSFSPVNDFPFIHRVVHWLVTLLRALIFVHSCSRPLPPSVVAWCILVYHTYWLHTTDSPSFQLHHSYGITWSRVDDTCFLPPLVISIWTTKKKKTQGLLVRFQDLVQKWEKVIICHLVNVVPPQNKFPVSSADIAARQCKFKCLSFPIHFIHQHQKWKWPEHLVKLV